MDFAAAPVPRNEQRVSAAYNMACHGSMYLQECEYGHAATAFNEIIAILEAVIESQPTEPKAAQEAAPEEPLFTDGQIEAAVAAWFANDRVGGINPFAKRMRAAFDAANGIR